MRDDGSGFSVQVDRHVAGLEAYAPDLETLFALPGSEPSQSYAWLGALARNHVGENDELIVARVLDGKSVCAVVPLVARSETVLGLPFVTLSPLAEFYNTHSDILLVNRSPALFDALLDALYDMKLGWDVLRVKRMLEDNPLLGHFRNYAEKRALSCRIQYALPSFYLPLEGDFDSYFAGRSGKFRNYVRRKEKQIRKLGEMQIIEYDGLRPFDSVYRDILRVEEQSWKHGHGTAISAIDRQAAFYYDLCREAHKSGLLHLLLMYLDGKPVAYNMGMIKDGTYSYLKTSFSDAYRKSSPASVLRIHLVRLLYEKGIKLFDFPGEPYEWETQWTSDIRWHQSVALYNRRWKARFFSLLSRIRSRGQAAPERKLEYVDPRDLKAPSR